MDEMQIENIIDIVGVVNGGNACLPRPVVDVGVWDIDAVFIKIEFGEIVAFVAADLGVVGLALQRMGVICLKLSSTP